MSEILTSNTNIAGVWTALVTPFRGKKIALDSLEILIERSISAGIRGLIVLGTTGESPTITFEERRAIISCAVKTAHNRIPIFVGAGSNDTRIAVNQIRQAEELGAAGLLLVTPYYNKPTDTGLRKYFLTLADNSSLPIILYHIPGRCAIGISIPLTLELANHQQIIGIKDAGGDVFRVGEIARMKPSNFQVLAGDDGLCLPMMSLGAVGVVSVVSNLLPDMMVKMVNLALDDHFASALELSRKMTPLCKALFLETSPAPIKEALNLSGLKVGGVRNPLVGVTTQTRAILRKTMAELGISV